MLLLLQNTRLRLLCCNNAHVHVHSVTYSPAAQEVDKEPPFLDRLLRHAELWGVLSGVSSTSLAVTAKIDLDIARALDYLKKDRRIQYVHRVPSLHHPFLIKCSTLCSAYCLQRHRAEQKISFHHSLSRTKKEVLLFFSLRP